MLFESLENRSLLATITGNTAIGGFEALNSASLLYQLNASSLALANGTPVTAWNNTGTAANNFTQGNAAKQPTYIASGALGNNLPAVSFDGDTSVQTGNPLVAPNADELLLSTSTAPATLFIVNSTTTTTLLAGIIGQELGDFGIRRQSTSNWQHPGNSADLSNPGALYVNGVGGTNPAAALNFSHVLTATRPAGQAMAPTSLGDYFQVGTVAARSWGGQIGDVLALSRTVSSIEQAVVQNALASKYNITLGAGDLYVGDTPANGDYDFGVFGIGAGTSSPTNVAQGKAATESSDYGGYPASNAVDGILTNFSHTASADTAASLTIDLGSTFAVSDVLLRNRGDGCCQYRLRDVTVELWTTNPASPGSPVFTSPLLNPGNVLNGPASIPVPTLTAGNPTNARWVVVRRTPTTGGSADDNNVLSLGEVQVTGSTLSADLTSAGQAGFGLETTAPISAGSSLLAGYKLAANALVTTDLPAGVDKRWDRTWYVDKTGTLNGTLAFDFSDAGLGAIPASTIGYQLLYSPNNNFEAANSSFSVIPATPVVVGDTITFAVANGSLADGYYTLGLLDASATLQPDSATASNGTADAWRIVRSGAAGVNLDFYSGATLVRTSPYASITGVNVTGSNDNDTFTVDQTGGVIAKPITYAGGGQTSTPGDSLVITGGTATTVTHTFFNNNDGSVNIDGTLIIYTGLEPITDNMTVADRVFTFTGTAEAITVVDSGGADNKTRIDSSLGEFVDFITPTNTLTINTNGGDTATINSFDSAFNTPVVTLADASGTTSTFNLGASNVIPDASAIVLTGNVNFNTNGFSETIFSLASTNATPNVTLSAGQTLTTGNNATATTYSGTISGSGTLVKTGTANFTVAGGGTATNSASGLLRIDGGTLILGAGFTGDGAWQGNITINNTGTLQFAQSNIVNNSTDFTINTGGVLNMAGFSDAIGNLQGAGSITNNGGIVLDDLSGTRTYSGTIAGGGGLTLRGAVDATGTQVLDGTSYALNSLVVGRATLTFNNTPTVTVTGTMAVGDTNGAGVASGAIAAVLNINGGTYTIGHVEVGNRQSGSATVTATINQAAGTVSVTGLAVDGANLRIGHWPSTNAFYNLSGTGILNPAIAIGTAVDGNGTFTQTGGTLNTPGIIVNLRSANGTGTFTLNGGTTNIGTGGITTTGTPGTNSFLNLGGGTVRATGTWSSTHDAVLTSVVGPAVFDTNTFNITMSGVLSGPGALIKNSTGVLTLSGNNSFSGAVTVNGGTLAVADIANSGANSGLGSGTPITLNGGTLRFTAAAVDSSNRPLTLGAGGGGIEVSVAGGDITYSGGVTGGTAFTKFGPGNLTFSPANLSFSNLYVSGGTLTLAGSGTTTVTGTILPGAATADGAQATGNGTLNIQGSVVVNASAVSVNNQSSTLGTVNQSGTSAVTVSSGFRIGHWPGGTGTYNVSGGTLALTGNPTAAVNPAGVGEQNGVIYLGVDGTGVMNISGTAAVTATGVVLDARGNTTGTDTLTISGGSLTLGNNTNATTIAGSGLFTGSSNANTTYQINLGGGGTLRSITPFTTPLNMTLTGAGASAINVDTNGVNLAFTGILSGPGGGLTKAGAGNLLLTNANTYSDVTNVNGGTLQLQNGAAILDTAGAVNVALGATLQLLNNETVSSYNGAGDLVGTNDSTLALGANTLTTTGTAAIANVTTAAGAGVIAGTTITDTDDDNNITGPNVYLQATNGIGTAGDPIETAVSNIQLNNATSGVVNIVNTSALLGISDLRALAFGSRNLGGATTIVNSSQLNVVANVVSAGSVVLTATDTAAISNDSLNVAGGVTIQSTGSTLALNAGDNALIPATSRLTAAGNVTVNVDLGNADGGTGGNLLFAGDIDAPLAIFNGAADSVGDSFNTIKPDQDVGDVLTPIQVNGFGPPSNPNGDSLVLDITGLGIPVLTLGPGARNGSFSFGALAAPLTYTDIENVSTSPALPYHLVLDMKFSGYQNTVADTILAQLDAAGTNLLLDVNGGNVFTGLKSAIQSLTIIGSTDNDALTIQQTAGGLPKFLGGAPAVNNTGIGGGVSAGSHLNSNADLALETLRAIDTPWDAGDVTIHFDGGAAGTDSLAVNYTTFNNTGYFSDTSDAGNSGNVMSAPGAFPVLGAPTFLMSFANLEPLNLNSTAGGLLLTDASGTAATSTLVATDIGTTTQITGDNGFATTTFGGYNSLVMVGGGGSELIDIISIDGATPIGVTVIAGNTNDLLSQPGGDNSADTIRLRSLPANASANLSGNAGSDLFQLFDAGNTVDNTLGPVVVDGNDGNLAGNTDTLTIVDSGDGTGDLGVVISAVSPGSSQDYSVEGINTATGSDVIFRNIDNLNYTGTAGVDQIDGRFESTAPAHDLSIVNLSGWTGADQFLLYTSDQIGGTGANNTPTGTPSGIANINLYGDAPGNPNGGDGNDTFGATPPLPFTGTGAMNVGLVVSDNLRMIRPSASTSIAIDGGTPTGLAAPLGDAAGDVLNVNISALPNTSPVIVSTFGPGTVVANGIQPLTWVEIEDINLVDQGKLTNVQMGDLFARTTPNPDLVQITKNPTTLNPNQVRLRITATIGNYSASNKTIIYAGAMNDTLTQANLTIPAEFYGEAGDDYLTGATNNDWLVGGDGNDRLNGGLGDNILWGDNSPTNPSDPQPQDLAAGGDDQLSGLTGSDVFYGGGGNDQVSAGGGNDYAYGGEGNDTLDGNDGDDRLYGGNGNDTLNGHEGHDLLCGAAGDDKLYGNGGNDVLFGGTGADLVDGGAGNDLLVSGSVANETSSWTSQPTTATYNAATYTRGADNDAALLTLLAQWSATSNRGTLGTSPAITHDGANDDLWGNTGDDDFCWEAADVLDNFPGTTPSDYNAQGMGTDERFGPT